MDGSLRTVNRCILLFPRFPNGAVIDGIREKYDPTARLVPPHVTLVFPFESQLGAREVEAHMRAALAGFRPFTLSLQGISEQRGFGNYLLLNVHDGKNTVKDMHRRLYTGMLAQYKPAWCRTFEPHMTVGKVEEDGRFALALDDVKNVCDRFTACVGSVFVEVIGPDGGSTIETELVLPVN